MLPVLLGSMKETVLSGDGARELIRASIQVLASTSDAALAERRAALQDVDRGLTGEINRLVSLAEDGEVEEIGARLKELRRDRDHARADLATLPEPAAPPSFESVDVEGFVRSLLGAFDEKPVLETRQALSRMLDSIELRADGSAKINYAWRDPARDIHQSPFGAPEGSAPRNRGWVGLLDVQRPRVRIVRG